MRNTFRYSFATVLTAGLVIAPFSAAFADATTDGSGGVGSGNQVVVPVEVEADLCGNSLAILGISKAQCTKVSEVLYESSGQSATTDGSGGVASGNQIIVPVDAALDVCGNSVAVAGVSEAECTSVVEVLEDEGTPETTTTTTDGSGGVASGNQIVLPVDAAVEICGNSVAILGSASAKCTTIINIIHASDANEAAPSTDGSGGVASGNQVVVPVDAAVEICGNAVSVLGLAESSCVEKISDDKGDKDEDKDDKGKDEDKDEDDKGKDEDKGDKDEDKDEDKDDKDKGKDEGDKEKEDDSSGASDDKPAPVEQAGGSDLAVTGGALSGLVAAALAAVGAGGAGLYFARKRKAAAATGEE